MYLKRKIFEYGIFSMALSCILILGLLFMNVIAFLIGIITDFNFQEVNEGIRLLIQSGNYIQVILILTWCLFFLGVFLITTSIIIQMISSLFFKTNLLKNIKDERENIPERIAIVIPAFNEEKTIKKVITDCKKYSKNIIVVNDGSTDNTQKILDEFSDITVLANETNLGLGKTMKRGIEYASNLDLEVIVTFDADGQYRSEEIPKIASLVLKKEADLVLGSRFAGKIEKMPLSKRLGNKMMSFALSMLLGLRITDGQTGFRGISKNLALSYRLRGEYTYTQEMIIQARFLRRRIVEIPIYFDERIGGSSRLIRSPVDYALKSWLTILRTLRDFQPIWFFGGFGFISFLLGLFFFSITAVSSVTIPVPFDLTIFSTLLMLIGVQLIFFGFLADARRSNS